MRALGGEAVAESAHGEQQPIPYSPPHHKATPENMYPLCALRCSAQPVPASRPAEPGQSYPLSDEQRPKTGDPSARFGSPSGCPSSDGCRSASRPVEIPSVGVAYPPRQQPRRGRARRRLEGCRCCERFGSRSWLWLCTSHCVEGDATCNTAGDPDATGRLWRMRDQAMAEDLSNRGQAAGA